MPKPLPKPKKPVAIDPTEGQKVYFPKVELRECWGPRAITYEQMSEILGWETEGNYKARMKEEAKAAGKPIPEDKELEWEEGEYVPNWANEKCKMWRNLHNRPFEAKAAEGYMQSILQRGDWAGPINMANLPEFANSEPTVNGEAFIVSRTAQVLSGQKRGVGFMWAVERWRTEKDKWRDKWPTEPVFETVLVVGISDSPRIVGTLDNVSPRTLSDTFYTSPVFADLKPAMRKEASKSLDAAVDWAWKRTAAKTEADAIQTHQASKRFSDRHPKLGECVRHMIELNAAPDRRISNLALLPGQCAGLEYLMAQAETIADEYRKAAVPTEEMLDFSKWDNARNFWIELTARAPSLQGIRDAFETLSKQEHVGGGRAERMAVLVKAFGEYAFGGAVTEANIMPTIVEANTPGIKKLDENCKVGGIDMGNEPGSGGIRMTKEEKDAELERLRNERAVEVQEKVRAGQSKKAADSAEAPTEAMKRVDEVLAKSGKTLDAVKAKATPPVRVAPKALPVQAPAGKAPPRPAPKPAPQPAVNGKKK